MAAIAYDATSNGAAVLSSNPQTFNHTCSSTGGRYMIAITQGSAAPTYAGVTMTLLRTYNPPDIVGPPPITNSCPTLSVYGLANPATGTNTFSVANAGGAADTGVVSYTGVGGVDVYGEDDSTTENGSDTQQVALTVTTTTTKDNCWLVGVANTTNAGTKIFSGATNGSLRYAGASSILVDSVGIVDSNGAKTPAGAYDLGITRTAPESCFISMIVVALYPAVPRSTYFMKFADK